jgi:hypothetical protein
MTDLFKKLNWKGHAPVILFHAPASFAADRDAMAGEVEFHTDLRQGVLYPFALAFAVTQAEMTARAAAVCRAATPEAIVWLCYPKQTSKAFKSDLNRDLLWKLVEPLGLEPNRQIAIDDDWSALRFKKV